MFLGHAGHEGYWGYEGIEGILGHHTTIHCFIILHGISSVFYFLVSKIMIKSVLLEGVAARASLFRWINALISRFLHLSSSTQASLAPTSKKIQVCHFLFPQFHLKKLG